MPTNDIDMDDCSLSSKEEDEFLRMALRNNTATNSVAVMPIPPPGRASPALGGGGSNHSSSQQKRGRRKRHSSTTSKSSPGWTRQTDDTSLSSREAMNNNHNEAGGGSKSSKNSKDKNNTNNNNYTMGQSDQDDSAMTLGDDDESEGTQRGEDYINSLSLSRGRTVVLVVICTMALCLPCIFALAPDGDPNQGGGENNATEVPLSEEDQVAARKQILEELLPDYTLATIQQDLDRQNDLMVLLEDYYHEDGYGYYLTGNGTMNITTTTTTTTVTTVPATTAIVNNDTGELVLPIAGMAHAAVLLELSPQYQAMEWMIHDPDMEGYTDVRLLQRFALATLYYAFSGPQWNQNNTSSSSVDSRRINADTKKEIPAEEDEGGEEGEHASHWPPLPEGTEQWYLSYTVDECDWLMRWNNSTSPQEDETGDTISSSSSSMNQSSVVNDTVMTMEREPYDDNPFCHSNGIVTWFILEPFPGFRGSLPAEIGLLSNLEELDMSHYHQGIAGTIPSEIESLTDLTLFRFAANALTGSLPTSIGKLSDALTLDLNSNLISGSLPSHVGKLTGLQQLFLQSNLLSGFLPTHLGVLTDLRELYIYDNPLLQPEVPMELCEQIILAAAVVQDEDGVPSNGMEQDYNGDYEENFQFGWCQGLEDCCPDWPTP